MTSEEDTSKINELQVTNRLLRQERDHYKDMLDMERQHITNFMTMASKCLETMSSCFDD